MTCRLIDKNVARRLRTAGSAGSFSSSVPGDSGEAVVAARPAAGGDARRRDRARARDAARHGADLGSRRRLVRARRLAPACRRRGRGALAAVSDAPPVAARGLVKRYGEITAVDDVDLTVERGDVFGYLGPNGAGKTTSLRMLLGLIRPTSGQRAAVRPRSRCSRGRAGARRGRGVRRGPALLSVPLRPQEPAPARRPRRRRAAVAHRGGARRGRPARPREGSSRRLLARDEAAARHRGVARCATRSCSCSTSRRPVSIPPGCATCASS